MAIGFEIKGKCLLKQGSNVIGMSDEADTISVVERVFSGVYHSNESGPNIPALIIEHGRYCEIRAPLTQFDRALLEPLLKAQGASSKGQIGTLGASKTLSSWNILPAITGQTSYTFPSCYLIDAINLDQWGLMPHKVIIVLQAIPDPTALSTATTPYYTTTTV